jgi:hypothetical protein
VAETSVFTVYEVLRFSGECFVFHLWVNQVWALSFLYGLLLWYIELSLFLFYIHNKDTEMVNMKVDRQKRLLVLRLFSFQLRWREFCPSPDDVYTLIHSRDNKLSWVVGHIAWECWMLPGVSTVISIYITWLCIYPMFLIVGLFYLYKHIVHIITRELGRDKEIW